MEGIQHGSSDRACKSSNVNSSVSDDATSCQTPGGSESNDAKLSDTGTSLEKTDHACSLQDGLMGQDGRIVDDSTSNVGIALITPDRMSLQKKCLSSDTTYSSIHRCRKLLDTAMSKKAALATLLETFTSPDM